jgi:hypothetical protein
MALELWHPLTYVGARFLLQRTLPTLLHPLDLTGKEQKAQKRESLNGHANCGDEANWRNGLQNKQDSGDHRAEACANNPSSPASLRIWKTHPSHSKSGQIPDLLTVVIGVVLKFSMGGI